LIESGLVKDIEVCNSYLLVPIRGAIDLTPESKQGLGWKVDFQGADKLTQSIHSDGSADPDIGILKKPRLVSKVRSFDFYRDFVLS